MIFSGRKADNQQIIMEIIYKQIYKQSSFKFHGIQERKRATNKATIRLKKSKRCLDFDLKQKVKSR